mmetsp:Transcript_29939/g.92705  ORF Transcript_29939/g.92705 Transcript_29939/m.92705 type:complete len:214 (-) Transcript_29939:370-1011(-)
MRARAFGPCWCGCCPPACCAARFFLGHTHTVSRWRRSGARFKALQRRARESAGAKSSIAARTGVSTCAMSSKDDSDLPAVERPTRQARSLSAQGTRLADLIAQRLREEYGSGARVLGSVSSSIPPPASPVAPVRSVDDDGAQPSGTQSPSHLLDAANVYKRRKSSADGEDPDAKGLAVAAVAPSHVSPDPPSRALPPDGAAPVASPPQRDRGL